MLSLVVPLVLSGCGGGGSDADTTPAPTGQGAISGSVVKGPVSGATVSAHRIDNGAVGPAIASATTDAHGDFMLSVGNHAGHVLLQMTGGTYTDEATGAAMSMRAGDVMTAMIADMQAGSTVSGVQVTPLTSMAQAMAQHMPGGMTGANIHAAHAAVGAHFMVDDVLHTRPMNPLVAGSGSTATQHMMNYGMTLAAMSQYAKEAGMPMSSAIVASMMEDASDGWMNGATTSGPIVMGGMMGGDHAMHSATGTSGLAGAMQHYVDSSLNHSGVTASHMSELMHKLSTSDGHMH
jgi:hypothetical protein